VPGSTVVVVATAAVGTSKAQVARATGLVALMTAQMVSLCCSQTAAMWN
jgi:hypothetical protein